MELSPEQRYAEEVAVSMESMGLPRAYGKLLGWLLICDPPHQSSAELAAALNLSKSSVSTGTRMLENAGLVRRVPAPGRRGKVFEMTEDAFMRSIAANRFTEFLDLTERGLELIGDENSPRARRLALTRDFYAFISRELPRLVARFHQERRDAARAPDYASPRHTGVDHG
jgi:DNA-binding transcriptional regulator GbsR (MarR family)